MLAYTREEAECDLSFAGFIIAECPLKPHSLGVIMELKESSHEVKMITGDNALTAAYIGRKLTFGNGEALFASKCSKTGSIIWRDHDNAKKATTESAQEVRKLAETHMLCINGNVLDVLILVPDAASTVRSIDIFSRTSPAQKAIIVGMLN